jgi:hypothetical protein
MKKYILKYMIVLAGISVMLFPSCEEEELITFDNSNRFVAFELESGKLGEGEDKQLAIPVSYAATNNDNPKVVLEISAEGMNNPAVENEDFTISSKELTFKNGFVDTIYISSIDNDVRDKDKTVNIVIKDAPEGVTIGYAEGKKSAYTLTIADDEHPLAKYIGAYTGAATDQSSGSVETWANVTTGVVEGDETKLTFTGIAGSSETVVATTDLSTGEISIAAGQTIGDVYGYGEIGIVNMYYDADQGTWFTRDGQPVAGTLKDDGSIEFTDWGHDIVAGDYASYIWGSYDVTFTKQ